MEQYAAMNEQMLPNYSLWEQEYYNSGEMGTLSQGFSETNDFFSNAKSVPTNPDDLDHHRNNYFPRNEYVVVSSPETANPGKAKQQRRRSKGGAAGSQSTTFLNASISNFRALVQQHTGCHNTTTSSPKGPITLCFGAPSSTAETPHHIHHHQYYYS